jgi:hypothetical protein
MLLDGAEPARLSPPPPAALAQLVERFTRNE